MRQKIKTFIGITKYTLVNRNYQAVITTVTIGRLIWLYFQKAVRNISIFFNGESLKG